MENNEKVQNSLFEEERNDAKPLASEQPRKSHRRRTLPEGARRRSLWSTDNEMLYIKEFLVVLRNKSMWDNFLHDSKDFLKELSAKVEKRRAWAELKS